MSKLATIFGFILIFGLFSTPTFPVSLQFDFDGDPATWETEWTMSIGETVEVDVWLDEYTGPPIMDVIYKLNWEPTNIEVMDAWAFDTIHNGEWHQSYSYAHIYSDGEYWYKAGDYPGIPVDNKIKLHTIVLKNLTGSVNEIKTVSPGFPEIWIQGGYFGATHAAAIIHPPTEGEIAIDPETKTVFTGDTVQFTANVTGDFCEDTCYTWEVTMKAGDTGGTIDANGLYTAREVGTEKITVTDNCNGGISAEATVEVTSASSCKVTISPEGATVLKGETIQFSASVSGDDCDDPNPAPSCYTWEVTMKAGDTGGTIDANGLYTASRELGTEKITVTDNRCNNDVSDTATVKIVSSLPTTTSTTTTTTPPPPPPPPPPPVECNSDNDCANDDLFCNGEVDCRNGRCQPSGDPCPDDGLFCNGEETCDEDNDECLPGDDPCLQDLCDEDNDVCVPPPPPPPCDDADCSDGLFCNGEETCDENGACQSGNDPCADDGLFCNGDETCDEDSDICVSSGDPCIETDNPVCNEDTDVCAPPLPPPLEFNVIPDQALRSHLIPLPLFMFLVPVDEGTSFDRLATTVNSTSDAITPLWTFVLTEDLIFAFAFSTPAGLETTGSREVEIKVTVNERSGLANLNLHMLPWILDEGSPR